ncbi:sensor histidine kinase [Pseudoprimorskyibacter insulae]|uniref:C4-dicarboxylate transport sensor protein DctB n=1 Tax=Pseudoprimorskyibacter insulae TaxID=1695997 RepID=A0A2R8AX08_9RHOB|nr:ATP-binding protein [Pseudoprimorskyibacter insulae]SPF80477.1 C4-dicarboxylate transport sensor protein DctB [Pseudoprimorskyibacter insulae]
MSRLRLNRTLLVAGFLSAVAVLSAGVWSYGYRQALEPVAARGEADLALASDRLVTQLERYRETAVLMAEHPVLSALHDGVEGEAAVLLLLQAVDKTAALTAFYTDTAGRVLAASHKDATPTDLTTSPYFRRALHGALGAGHGWNVEFSRRSYSFAAPSFGPDDRVRGVLVVVVDLDNLEQDWRGSRPAVFFTDASGQIYVTNRSELLFWQHAPGGLIAPDGRDVPINEQIVAGNRLWVQSLSPYVPRRALHLVKPLPVIGMQGEALVDTAPARRLAFLQAAVVAALCLSFGAVLFVVLERRRTLALANSVLEVRVQERTKELSEINTELRREVMERQEAEAALKRAQADLVQAGKLSALGQMSAGISHELNQPLMAIRQFAENGEAFLAKGREDVAGDNLRRISQLAARAARIIKNLRSFARNESEPMGKVDLVEVIGAAVELTEARLRAEGVTLDWQPDRANGPVYALGGEVRLSQVFVNLINNAADAMVGRAGKRIAITLQTDPRLSVTVSDTGPGIADPERIFEPFYSTKQVSGDGMGLGLSISYGLVQSFGGIIKGANLPEGGACFTVELEAWRDDVAA